MSKTPELQRHRSDNDVRVRTDNSKVINQLQKENNFLLRLLDQAFELLESEGYRSFTHNGRKLVEQHMEDANKLVNGEDDVDNME